MSAEAGVALWRALARTVPGAELDWMESRGWASATFAGERHRLCFTAADDDGLMRWLATAPEAEWRLRGHLVADIAVASVCRVDGRASVTLDVLTLEDA